MHYLTDPASVELIRQVRLGSMAPLSNPTKIGQTWPNPSTHLLAQLSKSTKIGQTSSTWFN
jgi:hypothetical protein